MAKQVKKLRKQAIYHNSYLSTQTPDERERSLMPGTREYKRLQAERLGKAFGVNPSADEQKQKDLEEQEKHAKQTALEDDSVDIAPEELEKTMAHDVAVRKFRRKRGKERKVGEAQKIAKDAIDKDIPEHNPLKIPGKRSMDEELQDDGIDEKKFVGEVLRDYESDLREIYNADNNKDGQTDEDDITPGMRKMMRYM